MSECTAVVFPAYVPGLPTRVAPLTMVIASLPSIVTAVLWIVFECTSRPSQTLFSYGVVLTGRGLALLCTGAQAYLVHRIFDVFDCESTFRSAKDWVALPLVALASTNVLLVFAFGRRYPRACAAVSLLLAAGCVSGEYLGRNVLPTSGVQHLVPIQQLYCVVLVTLLTNPRGIRASSPLAPTNQKKGRGQPTPRVLKAVDPLQPSRSRRGEEDEREKGQEGGWSWWA